MGTKYHHLTWEDRLYLERLTRQKYPKKEIAKIMGCSLATVYNELKRGAYEHLKSDLTTEIRYSPQKAYDEAVKGSEDVKAAQEEYDKALAAEKNLKTEYDNAKNKTADTEKTYADVLDMLNKAQDKLKRAQGLSFEAAKENEITDPDFAYLNDYVARAKAAEKKAEDANAAVSALAEALEKAKAEYEKAKKARELAELNLMLAQAEYDMFAPQEKPEEPKPEGQTPAGKPEQKPEKPSGQEDSKDKAPATGDVNDMTQAAVAGAGAVGILALLKSRFRKRED